MLSVSSCTRATCLASWYFPFFQTLGFSCPWNTLGYRYATQKFVFREYSCLFHDGSLTESLLVRDNLPLLAAPTWLWGRCGRHNSPPASPVMDFIFCCSCPGCHSPSISVAVFLDVFSQVVPSPGRGKRGRPKQGWMDCVNHKIK